MQIIDLSNGIRNDAVSVTNVYAVHNQIIVAFQSDILIGNYCDQFPDGCRASAFYGINETDISAWVEGEWVEILGQRWYISDTPRSYELPSVNAVANAQELFDAIWWALSNNTYINSRYSLEYDYPLIEINSKYGGANYNVTASCSANMTQNDSGTADIYFETFDALNKFEAQQYSNYGFWVQVYATDNPLQQVFFGQRNDPFVDVDDWINLGRLEKSWNNSNLVTFDIASLLKKFCYGYNHKVTQLIATNQANFERVLNGIYRYKLLYGYYYKNQPTDVIKYIVTGEIGTNSTLADNSEFPKTNLWAFNAAVNTNQFRYEDIELAQYWDRIGTTQATPIKVKPLTLQPAEKPIHYEQKEYLTFAVYKQLQAYTVYQLYLTVTLYDGTVLPDLLITERQYNAIIGSQYWGGVFVSDVSPAFLGLNSIETANNQRIAKYKVTIKESLSIGNTTNVIPITEQTYIPQHQDRCSNNIYMMWQNKLGGFDSIYFSSYLQSEVSYNKDVYERKSQYVDKNNKQSRLKSEWVISKIGNASVNNKDNRYIWSISSGWIDKQTYIWLKDLMDSNEVYVHNTNSDFDTLAINDLIPVVIDKVNWSYNQFEDIFQVTFNATSAIERTVKRI